MEINKKIYDKISDYRSYEDVKNSKNTYKISVDQLFNHNGWLSSLSQFELPVSDYLKINSLLNEFCTYLSDKGYSNFLINSTVETEYDSYSESTDLRTNTFISFQDDFDTKQIAKYKKQKEAEEERKKVEKQKREEREKLNKEKNKKKEEKNKEKEERLKKVAEKKEKELFEKLKKKYANNN